MGRIAPTPNIYERKRSSSCKVRHVSPQQRRSFLFAPAPRLPVCYRLLLAPALRMPPQVVAPSSSGWGRHPLAKRRQKGDDDGDTTAAERQRDVVVASSAKSDFFLPVVQQPKFKGASAPLIPPLFTLSLARGKRRRCPWASSTLESTSSLSLSPVFLCSPLRRSLSLLQFFRGCHFFFSKRVFLGHFTAILHTVIVNH